MIWYFAPGSRCRRRDLDVAVGVGQHHFLVPAGSLTSRYLRQMPGIQIALDSGAWPPQNPQRLSLRAYWEEIKTWRDRRGEWLIDWAASFDHLGHAEAAAATARDSLTLLSWAAQDAPDAPIVPVAHYEPGCGRRLRDQIVLDLEVGWAGTRADLVAGDGAAPTRPGYAIGGLVPYHTTATAQGWYRVFAEDMQVLGEELDPTVLRLHLFGVGSPYWLLAAPGVVTSGDSSGPARQAQRSEAVQSRWFDPQFGYSREKLMRSREARLALCLARYRARLGLPWHMIPEDDLLDDGVIVPFRGWRQEQLPLAA